MGNKSKAAPVAASGAAMEVGAATEVGEKFQKKAKKYKKLLAKRAHALNKIAKWQRAYRKAHSKVKEYGPPLSEKSGEEV